MFFSVSDHIIHILEHVKRVGIIVLFFHQRFEETGTVSCMAGCAHLLHFGKDRIIITVNGKRFYILYVSGCQTFGPELIPAAAPVCHFSKLQCCVKSKLIHIGKHQYFIRPVILDNNRNHSVTV